MYHIYIDGDNISLEKYFENINSKIKAIVRDEDTKTFLVCQSNIIFKYKSNRNLELTVICCETKNKDATDAQIIYNSGKSVNAGNKVIIVSNDKIYEEIENDDVYILNYTIPIVPKTSRLKKGRVINAINELNELNKEDPSYDIYLEDIQTYFPSYELLQIRRFIESLVHVKISNMDTIYID